MNIDRIEGCYFPSTLLYDLEGNTWIKIERNSITIGITSLLAWFLGKFTTVRYMSSRKMGKNEIICSLESVRSFTVVRSPIQCEIIDKNQEIVNRPILLNKDPYESGWIAKLLPLESLDNLDYKGMEEIKERITENIKKFRIKCFSEFPDYEFIEIGVECSAVLAKINELFSKVEIGTVVHVVTDDPLAKLEAMRWQDQTGQKFVEHKKENGLQHIIVKKIK